MSSRSRAFVILIVVAFVDAAGFAQQHPNLATGFAPDRTYDTSGIESVNLQNGALALTIPIGITYPVGGNVAYGLSLVYNSNVWNFRSLNYEGEPLRQLDADAVECRPRLDTEPR